MTNPLPFEPDASLDDTLKSQRSKSYDPAKPLDPPRYEKFVIQVFRGVQKYQAYQAAILCHTRIGYFHHYYSSL